MLRKHHFLVLMTITICSIPLIALGVEDDLGGDVTMDGNILDFSLLIGCDAGLDFTVPSSPGFGTTTARSWQDPLGGRITLKFPAPCLNKLIVSLEDTPKAEKRFFIRARTEDNTRDFAHVTSEWQYQLPADVAICLDGEARNIKQLTWSRITQIDSKIRYLRPSEIVVKMPVVKVESKPHIENLCRVAIWTQIIAGTEEKNIDSSDALQICNIEREEPEVIAGIALYKENPCRLTTWTQIIAGTEKKCDENSQQGPTPE